MTKTSATVTPPKAGDPKELKLPSGKVAIMRDFKGKDVREAQRLSEGDPGKLLFGIIAITTTIDGNPVTLEDLDEMNGQDVFMLYGQFGGNFTSAPNS